MSTNSKESILLESETVTWAGVILVGLIILISVGAPTEYEVIPEFSGITKFNVVPVVLTVVRF